MKSKILRSGFIFCLFMLFFTNSLVSFGQSISKDELEERSMNNFQNENYENAIPDFQALYSIFPKDARIAYYLGRSYLHANLNLEDAVKLLKFAATRNYGEDSYYYLGRAYHLTYRFDDAILSLTSFEKAASNHNIKSLEVEYWLITVNNAKKSSSIGINLAESSSNVIPSNSPESAFGDMLNGKYIYVPDEFKSEADLETGYQTIMPLTDDIKIGEFLYFDSKSKKEKQGTDIYRVKRITEDDYSLPEPLSLVVNTQYDEAYPYFDKETSTLYFSSKGHNTSGGYDIFFTRFDPLINDWSQPEKLSFPINTPFNDFLYTITKDRKKAIFISNRKTGKKELSAYIIENQKTPEFISINNREDLLLLADLKSPQIAENESIPLAINVNIEKPEEKNTTMDAETQRSETRKPEESLFEIALNEALNLQVLSDSLQWAVKEMKGKIENEREYQKKQELIANITIVNEEAMRMQRLADEKLLEAEKLRVSERNFMLSSDNVVKTSAPTEKIEKVENEGKAESGKEINYQRGLKAASIASNEIMSGYKILNSEPYSAENPIPEVSELPSGLIYRIQLGAFSSRVPENTFGGLTPVSAEIIRDRNITKYYVGYFTSITEARKALESIKEYGYPDAFMISYFDKEKITVERAREIEFAEK